MIEPSRKLNSQETRATVIKSWGQSVCYVGVTHVLYLSLNECNECGERERKKRSKTAVNRNNRTQYNGPWVCVSMALRIWTMAHDLTPQAEMNHPECRIEVHHEHEHDDHIENV